MTSLRAFFVRHQKWLIPVALGVAYFVYQYTQLSEYGVTWDEPLHRNWGKLFVAFWKTGDRRFLELMPGHGINYGPLYYVLNYGLSEMLYNAGQSGMRFVAANHVLNIAVASIAVACTYDLGRFFGGKRTGFLTTLFFVFFPMFLAHSHYNPKDIPLMAGLLISSCLFLRTLRWNSLFSFGIFGALLGISIALKVSALLMAPAFVAAYAVWLIVDVRKSSILAVFKHEWPKMLLATAMCILFVYIFWPSAWGDLLLIPKSIFFFLTSSFWPGQAMFFGTQYGGAALPWFYIPFEFIVSMPFVMLVTFAIGTAMMLIRLRLSERKSEIVFLLVWVFFPIVFSMKPGLVRYDGIRQFLFIAPGIAIIAAVGFDALLSRVRRLNIPYAVPAIISIVVLSLLHEVWILHPFEGSYRNELLRLAYPSHMEEQFEVEYWGAPYKQGLEWMVDNAEPNPVICVPTAGILVEWYPWRRDFSFECSDKSDYIMFFTRYDEAERQAIDKKVAPIHVIKRMNADLLKIYKIR